MKLYNTLTKKVEVFTPNEDNIVRIYTCGPTVYHFAHIGNLRTYIFEDILEKSLEYMDYNVLRVMNITDVGHLYLSRFSMSVLRNGDTRYNSR